MSPEQAHQMSLVRKAERIRDILTYAISSERAQDFQLARDQVEMAHRELTEFILNDLLAS